MNGEEVPADTVRIYRLEDNAGYGPVPRRKVKTSLHSDPIRQLLRDLHTPRWLRSLIGCKNPSSPATHRDDWVFGITNFKDLNDWKHSWLGKGCALSVYDVPTALVVHGEGEVMFWRGAFQDARLIQEGRVHPSGLAPTLRERIPEAALVKLLESANTA